MHRRDLLKFLILSAVTTKAFAIGSEENTVSIALRKLYIELANSGSLDYNDPTSRSLCKQRMTGLMQEFVNKKVIERFVVVCDESNNPLAVIQQGIVGVYVVWIQDNKTWQFEVNPRRLTA